MKAVLVDAISACQLCSIKVQLCLISLIQVMAVVADSPSALGIWVITPHHRQQRVCVCVFTVYKNSGTVSGSFAVCCNKLE